VTDGEEKGLVLRVAGWLWGTVKGGFNEQQTTSQIVVDAVIGMVPLVGDVTAIRDLLAVVLRLVREPERRQHKAEWIQLVILLFALVPVVGGAIKGVGQLLVRGGTALAKTSATIEQMIAVLNRLGQGDAVTWFRKLDLESYVSVVRAKWLQLTDRLTGVVERMLVRLKSVLPESMLEHLRLTLERLRQLKAAGERMIPDALKELNARLRQVQQQVYRGEWHEIPASLKSSTREAEARIVTDRDGDQSWVAKDAHHPQNAKSEYKHVDGWPDLRTRREQQRRYYAIEGFCGEIEAVTIPAGTRLYRVVDHRRPNPAGDWWMLELPQNGKQWRQDWAVLDVFSDDGFYVEFVVPPGGLKAWVGTASSQIDRKVTSETAGQYLVGGGTQVMIDFTVPHNLPARSTASTLPLVPTGWIDHRGINVPPPSVSVQPLGRHEVMTKKIPPTRAARLSAKAFHAGSATGSTITTAADQESAQ
jgi:hypothetical protein